MIITAYPYNDGVWVETDTFEKQMCDCTLEGWSPNSLVIRESSGNISLYDGDCNFLRMIVN